MEMNSTYKVFVHFKLKKIYIFQIFKNVISLIFLLFTQILSHHAMLPSRKFWEAVFSILFIRCQQPLLNSKSINFIHDLNRKLIPRRKFIDLEQIVPKENCDLTFKYNEVCHSLLTFFPQ